MRIAFEQPKIHLGRTMLMQQLGPHDPTANKRAHAFQKTFMLPSGEVTRHTLALTNGTLHIHVEGAQQQHGIVHWENQIPIHDGLDAFATSSNVLGQLLRACPGLRFLRMPWLFDVAAGVVLQQRVTFREATHAFARIARQLGTSTDLGVAFPTSRTLAHTSQPALERLGLDAKRARALVNLAAEDVRTGFLSELGTTRAIDRDAIRKRMLTVRGIGPWTTESTLGAGTGDTDAVPVGDLHLPSTVTAALAREPRGTDERMLKLLQPYRGQRYRVIRLVMAGKFAVAGPKKVNKHHR